MWIIHKTYLLAVDSKPPICESWVVEKEGSLKMAYVNPNFKTKKALKDALKEGKAIEVFQPGLGTIPRDGRITLEGPHYPKPHTWYAEAEMKDGKLFKVK